MMTIVMVKDISNECTCTDEKIKKSLLRSPLFIAVTDDDVVSSRIPNFQIFVEGAKFVSLLRNRTYL